MGDGGEFAVGLFHDICLGDDGYMILAVIFCVFKGCTGNTAGTGIGGDLEIHSHSGQFYTTAAQNILTLRIFPEEHPVDVLLRDAYRTAVGIQIQLPAHGHVSGFHSAAVRCGGGAFQQNIAGFDLRQNIVRDSLAACHTVLDG